MIPFLEDFKASGYGVYWSTIELMHERRGFLPLNDNTFKAIGKPLGTKSDVVKKMIESAISYELFFVEDEKFTADRVLRNLSIREKSTLQKVNAGKASAAKRQQTANGMATVVQQNPTKKERKKESIEIYIDNFGGNWENEKTKFLTDTDWMSKTYTQLLLPIPELKWLMDHFVKELELKEDYKLQKEIKSHFVAWFRKTKPDIKELKKFKPSNESSAPTETVREKHDRLSRESVTG